jgi:hypothetical protein
MCSDGDAPIACTVTKPKARKAHKCFECWKTIIPGETYEYTSGLWPDGPDTFKVCAICSEIRGMMKCKSVDFGSLRDQAEYEDFDFAGYHKARQPK